MRVRRLAFAIALLFAVGTPRAALAQPSDRAMAEALFQEARDLIAKGDVAGACKRFEESQRLEAKLGTLLNLAICHEQLGKTASAWGEFTEAAELAQKAGEADREKIAREHARTLDASLSRIVLKTADPPAALTIAIDGRALDGALVGTPLPLDPGEHKLEARAVGRKAWSSAILVPRGPARIVVEVPKLEAESAALPRAAAASPKAAPPDAAPSPPAKGGLPAYGWVGVAVGGAGLAVGAITGIASLAQTSSIHSHCTNGQCPGQSSAIAKATTLANVSNVTLGVGLAGAALFGVALVLAPSSSSAPSAALRVAPAGVSMAGRF